MEKRNKLAFWGVQIKYSYIHLLVLYAVVLVGMPVWYLVQANVRFQTVGAEMTLFEHLQGMPVYLSFLTVVLGSQGILSVAYAKQEKNRLAMAKLLLEPRTVWNIRFGYSVLVTVASFLVHFISVFLLFFANLLLYPGEAFGIGELYPVFYRFRYLYLFYPVMNPWAALLLPLCVAGVSQVSVWVGIVMRYHSWIRSLFPVGVVLFFLFISYIPDMINLLVFGTVFAFVVIYVIVTGRTLYIKGEPHEADDGNGGANG